jgi:phosphoglycolate phosphatase
MNAVITAHDGPPLERDAVSGMTGLPLDAIFRLAWPGLTEDDAERYRIEYRAIYDRDAIPATRLYPGAREALRDFHRSGLLQATVTGKRAADCERILRGLGIDDDLDVYLGGDSVPRPKPARDLATHAIERLGVTPGEAVVVGDTAADIAMGRAAGARTIQVLWGVTRARIADADFVAETWSELRATIASLAPARSAILGR